MNQEISVVIPAYNREETIQRCIESILRQTMLPLEIIVVDDGSNDKTIQILKEFNNDKIKVIQQNHRGAQAARNLGILNAKGSYIAFLDSDDEWVENTIETVVAYISKEDKEKIFYCDCQKYDEKKQRKQIWRLSDCTKNSSKQILKTSFALFGCMFVPKEKLLKIGLLDERVKAYQEWDTAIRLSKVGNFVHIKKPLLIYHLHSGKTISKDMCASVNGYRYIIGKNRNEIKKLGYGVLAKHYKKIMDDSLKMRSMKGYSIFIQYLFLYRLCKVKDMRLKHK